MRPAAPLLLLVVALVLPVTGGCVRGDWTRTLRYEPVPDSARDALEPGTGLQRCLDLLGAPLWVWERPAGDGEGVALAYGWFRSDAWNVNASIRVTSFYSVSFDYNQLKEGLRGLVLFFDGEDRLESWQEGRLIDLVAEPPEVRPAFVE